VLYGPAFNPERSRIPPSPPYPWYPTLSIVSIAYHNRINSPKIVATPLCGGAILKTGRDLVWATLGEGGLVLTLAVIGWATRQPLIFASLGPTAYELVEQPQLRSARTYNIIVGHLLGLGVGFLAIYVLNAWAEPNVISTGIVSTKRLWAVAIAATLTTLATLILKAGQPAAMATTLLISLGSMQTRRDAIAITAGVLIIAALGEPVRRYRLKHTALRPVVDRA
jgi:hypothetical protein